MEVCMYKETVLQNITAIDELVKVGNGLWHQRLLSLPLPSKQYVIYVYTQFARTKQVSKTDDHLLTSVQLSTRRMDEAFDDSCL